MPPLVVVEELHHSFPDGWEALSGVSLSIERGEFLALIGPNGSGKTTLAKHLNGLLKPSRGRVLVAGMDTREVPVSTLAKHVGYVFQNPDHQIFSPTVDEELAFGPREQGVPAEEVQERVARELEAFGLAPYAQVPPAVLPPSLRRKVAVASVLTTCPELLILDEPTVGLDALEQEELLQRVAAYRDAGGTVLLISHDLELVGRWASRCALLSAGRLVALGAPEEVLTDVEGLLAAGMRPPALVQLSALLPELGLPKRLFCPEELALLLAPLFGS